jgi:hypothetical protein
MPVIICRRVEGCFFLLGVGVVFSPLHIYYVGAYLGCYFQYFLLIISVVSSIAVDKLLCTLYILCLVWRCHFFQLLDIVAVPALWLC